MFDKCLSKYESSEDEDYNPTNKEEAEYRLEHERKQRVRMPSKSAHQLFQEMKRECIQANKPKQITLEDPISLATRILNSESIKPNKRIVFAGKEFMLNEETGQLEIIEKKTLLRDLQVVGSQDGELTERKQTELSYQYLNHVLKAIYHRSRKINSIGKSKLDWNGFVKQEGMEEKLKYNRKGGVIQDMQFIKKQV